MEVSGEVVTVMFVISNHEQQTQQKPGNGLFMPNR